MNTVLEALKGINAYPIPMRTIIEIGEARGLSLNDMATRETLKGKQFKLAKADVLMWLSIAPNISQGGQSYSFSEDQRKFLRSQANALYAECDEDTKAILPTFGYKGTRL